MGHFFVLALVASLYPILLAAETIMFSLEHPSKLMLGYLAGATLTSFVMSFLIIGTLNGSSASSTSKHTVDPILNIALGVLILIPVILIATGRDGWRRERAARRAEKNEDKPPPSWQRQLNKGSARITFVVGILLSFPGAAQLTAMTELGRRNYSTVTNVLYVLAFTAIMYWMMEVPLIGYAIKPEWTGAKVTSFSAWLARSGGRVALYVFGGLALILIARGIVNW